MSKLETNTTSLQTILNTINNLPNAGSGGLDTSDATATASDILSGKTAYVNGVKVTGNISTVTQPNPTIALSGGMITAGYNPKKGYTTDSSIKTAYKALPTKSATTYTPTTSNQTIASGTYLTGTQTIKGDSNLVASNIKSGVSIFGVTGTYAGSSEDLEAELSAQETLISNITTALQNKVAGGSSGIQTCTVTIVDENYTTSGDIRIIQEDNGFVKSLDVNYIMEGNVYENILQNSILQICDTMSMFAVSVESEDGSSYFDSEKLYVYIGTSNTTITVEM